MIVIAPDKEPGLFKAGALATSLHTARRIQGWALSDEVPAITVNPFPDMADVAKEKGGGPDYRAWLLAQFVALGYKEYVPPVVEPEVVVAPEPIEVKPEPAFPEEQPHGFDKMVADEQAIESEPEKD